MREDIDFNNPILTPRKLIYKFYPEYIWMNKSRRDIRKMIARFLKETTLQNLELHIDKTFLESNETLKVKKKLIFNLLKILENGIFNEEQGLIY